MQKAEVGKGEHAKLGAPECGKAKMGKGHPIPTPGNLYRYQNIEVTEFDGCKSLKRKKGQIAKQNGLTRTAGTREKEILEQNGDRTHPPPGNNAKA